MRFLCRSSIVRRSVWIFASASAHFRGCECALTGPRLRTLGPASARSFFTPSTHTCRGIGRCACCRHPIHCPEGAERGSVHSFNYPHSPVAGSRQSAFRRQSSAFPAKRPSISVYILFTFSLQIIYILYPPTAPSLPLLRLSCAMNSVLSMCHLMCKCCKIFLPSINFLTGT